MSASWRRSFSACLSCWPAAMRAKQRALISLRLAVIRSMARSSFSCYGCGACHMVPGVHGARGLVGPPLFYLGQRTMIAGELPNSPGNLARWIQHPRTVEPKTAMPDLGLTEDQAYDIAAYLYTLPGPEGTRWTE